MKKLLLKIAILAVVVITINQLVVAFLPFSWGHKRAYAKQTFFEKHKDEYNVLFVGSSRFYRHIVPSQFDVSMLGDGMKSTSFNFGVNALANPQRYYIYDGILGMEPKNLDYVFIEMSRFYMAPNKKNMHTTQYKYWANLEHATAVSESIYNDEELSSKEKREYIKFQYLSVLEKNMNAGMGTDLLKLLTEKPDARILGPGKDGYYSFEDEIRISGTASVIKRQEQFHKKLHELEERRVVSEYDFKHRDQFEDYDKVHLATIQNIIKKSKEKGIKVIFVLVPRLANYKKLIPLYDQIPQGNKIELADFNKYPELYDLKYSFDRGHLNNEGATIFTNLLVNEFIKIRNSSK
jgi:hypothetical protein